MSPDYSRVIANIPSEARNQDLPEMTLAEIQEIADRRGPAGIRLSDARLGFRGFTFRIAK